jgi:hypothetical protein
MDASKDIARVESVGVKHPPILTEGRVSPEVLLKFDIACADHFRAKKIPEDRAWLSEPSHLRLIFHK